MNKPVRSLVFVDRLDIEVVKDDAAYNRLHEMVRFSVISDRRRIKVELGGDRDQYLLITRK